MRDEEDDDLPESAPEGVRLFGELEDWPAKDRMAALLKEAGFQVNVGKYSIRILGCADFSFQEYGGDIGEPVVQADADSQQRLLSDAKRVSDALGRAKLKHRFEVYDETDALVAYFHHDWPLKKAS